MASWAKVVVKTLCRAAAGRLPHEATELNGQWGSLLMRHPNSLTSWARSTPQDQQCFYSAPHQSQQHSTAAHRPTLMALVALVAPASVQEQALGAGPLLPLPTSTSRSSSPLGDLLPSAKQHCVMQTGNSSTMPSAPAVGVCPQLTSNPLYRLGSVELHTTPDHDHQRQPHHRGDHAPASTSGTAAATAADGGTASVLASALVDANARVCSARAQLMTAQADINMLLGVIERQQQLLQAATQARQELALLLAHQGVVSAAAPQDDGKQPHHTHLPQPDGTCCTHSWPGSASGCSNCCSDGTGSSSSTWSSSTSCIRASDSAQLGSHAGNVSSSIQETQQGGEGACSTSGTAGGWAVTVQPPGLFGARVHVSISRSRLCPGRSSAVSCGSLQQPSCTGTQHAVHVVDEQDQIGAGPGLPSTLVHNSSFKSCSLDCSKAPAAPLLEV